MGEVVKLNKDVLPHTNTPRVCGTCAFYNKKEFAVCHAQGGLSATTAWRECEGQYWMQKEPINAGPVAVASLGLVTLFGFFALIVLKACNII